jgi:hypothetical protein
VKIGRILLIIGGVVGGLIFAVGVLGMIITLTQPDSHESEEVVTAIVLMAVGLISATVCIFFAYRMSPATALGIQVGSSSLPASGGDLQQRYQAWFTWCQQAIGGDAVTLNAATMAAMTAPENPTAAASAEAARQASRASAASAVVAPPRAAKVRMLSRIGASTVGLLEPSERVLVSFWGVDRSARALMWGLAFGAIGSLIASSQGGAIFVTVTDRRVIALVASQFGGLARRVAMIEPRATVSARFPKALLGRRSFQIRSMGGQNVSIGVPRPWLPEALMAFELIQPTMTQVGVIR